MATNTRPDLIPGVVIKLHAGPFVYTATVLEVHPDGLGIVVAPNDDAKLVGYGDNVTAPNGTQLTRDPMHDFIGSAHLHAVKVVTRD